MARTLWLLRHGDAEAHGIRDDFDRRLTPRGVRQARGAGVALKRLGVRFDLVFTSPRVRALETAQRACEALGITPVVHAPLAGGFDAADAGELIRAAPTDGTLMLVGHEPDLSQLVAALSGSRVEMKKGALACVSGGVLTVLLRPREIELVAGL